MKKTITGGIITYTFNDTLPPVVFDTAAANESRKASAIIAGFAATLTDAAALSRTMPDGSVRVITEALRHEAVKARAAFLADNTLQDWTQRTVREIAQNPAWVALATAKGVDYTVVASAFANADIEAIMALA